MINYVLFKDGHEEPILWYSETPGRVEVETPSGRYVYCEYIWTHPTGYHYKTHKFLRFRGFTDAFSPDWVATDDIKEFRFVKENHPC